MNTASLDIGRPASATLRERFADLRNRLLGSAGFRRFASRLSFTRPLASRAAHEIFDLCSGFVYSQVLLACVRLSLFDLLADRPRTAVDIATVLDLPPAACDRLLHAAVALELLEARTGGRFGLGRLGAAMLDNEEVLAMVEHNALLYADLADPVARLRAGAAGTRLSACWPYATAGGQDTLDAQVAGHYSRLMTMSQARLCEQVLDAYPLDWNRCLLDVGGGEGRFALAAAERHPRLRLKVFDLPQVADQARARVARGGLARRIEVHGGDFFVDALPADADIATLLRVLFDHDDENALRILMAVRRALPPGGTILVAEPLAGEPGETRVGDAYFGMYLLAMGRGRPRTAAEIVDLLEQAGFYAAEKIDLALSLGNGLIAARA